MEHQIYNISILFMSRVKVLHRFLREPNHQSTKYSRIANRSNPFENTLTVLTDPNNDRELHLIGTTNSSTLLANRTRKLVETIKPDTLFVQTTSNWWKIAKDLNVHLQTLRSLHNQNSTWSQTTCPKPQSISPTIPEDCSLKSDLHFGSSQSRLS